MRAHQSNPIRNACGEHATAKRIRLIARTQPSTPFARCCTATQRLTYMYKCVCVRGLTCCAIIRSLARINTEKRVNIILTMHFFFLHRNMNAAKIRVFFVRICSCGAQQRSNSAQYSHMLELHANEHKRTKPVRTRTNTTLTYTQAQLARRHNSTLSWHSMQI